MCAPKPNISLTLVQKLTDISCYKSKLKFNYGKHVSSVQNSRFDTFMSFQSYNGLNVLLVHWEIKLTISSDIQHSCGDRTNKTLSYWCQPLYLRSNVSCYLVPWSLVSVEIQHISSTWWLMAGGMKADQHIGHLHHHPVIFFAGTWFTSFIFPIITL